MTIDGDFYRTLAKRSMCRAYEDRAVPDQVLCRILDASRRAPSAGHSQGVRFGVVTKREVRVAIAHALKEEAYVDRGFPRWLSSAPVHVLVGMCSNDYESRYTEPDKAMGRTAWPIPYDVLDTGKALMTLYLAATSEGLACGYLGPHRAAGAATVVTWPQNWRFMGLVTVGYADKTQQRRIQSHQRGWRPLDEVVHWLELGHGFKFD